MSDPGLTSVVRRASVFESEAEAQRTIDATLRALAACLTQDERREVASWLGDRYASAVREMDSTDPTPPSVDEFVDRVRSDAEVDSPRPKIRVALAGLRTVIGPEAFADLRAQLPPAYGSLFDPASVEPGATFVDIVADAGAFERDIAESAARATLTVLGYRLAEGEATDVAPYLRGDASAWLSRRATNDAGTFGADGFVDRVADRTGASEGRAREYVSAVGDALAESVPERERERAAAQLPDSYEPLLDLRV